MATDLALPIFPSVIAVTGTIGSGKSTVVNLLKSRGAFVVSADDLAREVVLPGSSGLEEVVKSFGRDILAPDGTLDRKKLGQIVFSDDSKRALLEGILHPRIRSLAETRFREAREAGAPLLVYEVPLLFEKGLNLLGFKAVLVVTADDAVCIDRVMKRDGLSRDDAAARLRTQMPAVEKMKGADIVIDNSSTLAAVEQQIDSFLASPAGQRSA